MEATFKKNNYDFSLKCLGEKSGKNLRKSGENHEKKIRESHGIKKMGILSCRLDRVYWNTVNS